MADGTHPRATRAALHERWRAPEGQDLVAEIISRLVRGKKLDGLPVGRIDGRWDLRGLWLAAPSRIPPAARGRHDSLLIRRTRLTSVDLSWASLPFQFERARVTDCVFDGVDWNLQIEGSRFQSCTFTRAKFQWAAFDYPNSQLQDRSRPVQQPRSRYVRCDFTRTHLDRYSGFGRAVIEDCVFRDTTFPAVIGPLIGADLIRTRFEGHFRALDFGWSGPVRENPPILQDVDVSQAQIDHLRVHAVRGSGLIR